jgi:hypothetical protein
MATTEAVATKYFFTVRELEQMDDAAIGRVHDKVMQQTGERATREDLKPWHECLQWQSDPDYRSRRVAEAHGRVWPPPKLAPEPVPEPEPTLAMPSRPQVTVRGGLSREDGKIIAGAVRSHLKKKYSTRSEINELFNSLNGRIRELETTVREMRAATDRRFSQSDERHAAAARHRRNLEARLRGEPVERSARNVSAEEPRQ